MKAVLCRPEPEMQMGLLLVHSWRKELHSAVDMSYKTTMRILSNLANCSKGQERDQPVLYNHLSVILKISILSGNGHDIFFLSFQNIEWIHEWLSITHLYSFSFSKINLSRKNNEYRIHYNGILLQDIFCLIHSFTPRKYDKINSIFKQLNGITVPLISIAKPQQGAFPVNSFSFVWIYNRETYWRLKWHLCIF